MLLYILNSEGESLGSDCGVVATVAGGFSWIFAMTWVANLSLRRLEYIYPRLVECVDLENRCKAKLMGPMYLDFQWHKYIIYWSFAAANAEVPREVKLLKFQREEIHPITHLMICRMEHIGLII